MYKSVKATNLYSLLLLAFYLFGMIILSTVFYLLELPDVWNTLITYVLLLFIPTLVFIKVSGGTISDVLRFKTISLKNIGLVILFSITIQPLMNVISALSSLFFTNQLNDYLIEVMSMPTFLLLIALAILPALFEEIPTRGMLLSGYEEVDIKIAAIINGLFFGMLHLNFQQFFYAFLLGCLFVYLVKATGSIFSSIIAHFIINGTQVLLLKISYNTFGNEYIDMMNSITLAETMASIILYLILAAIFTPVAILFLYLLIKTNKKEELLNFKFDRDSVRLLWSKAMIPFYITIVIFVIFGVLTELVSKIS